MRKTYNLSCKLITEKARSFIFGEGYCETWDVPLDLTEKENENEEFMPMMDFIYPLGKDFSIPDDFRAKLNNMTIVTIDEEYFLALTGGGMDLTWEIAETYINLGFYPPIDFCRLPSMSGYGRSLIHKKIIRLCNEALKIASGWNKQNIENNKSLIKKA